MLPLGSRVKISRLPKMILFNIVTVIRHWSFEESVWSQNNCYPHHHLSHKLIREVLSWLEQKRCGSLTAGWLFTSHQRSSSSPLHCLCHQCHRCHCSYCCHLYLHNCHHRKLWLMRVCVVQCEYNLGFIIAWKIWGGGTSSYNGKYFPLFLHNPIVR